MRFITTGNAEGGWRVHLNLLRGGEGWYRLNGGKTYSLLKGQAVVIPPDTPHEYASSEFHPWSIYWWHMKGTHAGLLFEGFTGEAEPAIVPVDQSGSIVELFQESYEPLQKGIR